MASSVQADFQERKRIVFTARGRSVVNVREPGVDGLPIGYTSTELLLIAVGNCMLGSLLNHELLKSVTVERAHATLEAEMADNPPRVLAIHTTVDLVVADPGLAAHQETLEQISCSCPMCNSLATEKTVELRLSVREPVPA